MATRARRSVLPGTLFLLLLAGCGPSRDITGTWASSDPSAPFRSFSCAADGTCYVMRANGQQARLTYEVDYARDPVSLDLRSADAPRAAEQWTGIVRFTSDRELRLLLRSSPANRPIAFTRDSPGVAYTRPPTR